MNPTEVSQGGLFSLLPAFSTIETPQGRAWSDQESEFGALLEGLTPLLEQSELSDGAQPLAAQLLPLNGQPLPQPGGEPIQPSVLLASIRQSQGIASSGLKTGDVVTEEMFAEEDDEGTALIPPSSLSDTDTPAVVVGATSVALSGIPAQQTVQLSTQPLTQQDMAALKVINGHATNNPTEDAAVDASMLEESELSDMTLESEGEAEGSAVTQIRSDQPVAASKVAQGADVADVKVSGMADITPVSNALSADAEITDDVIVTEAEAEQLEEQEQVTQNKERLEFGRDKEQWAPALGSRIVTMVADNIQQAEIHLDPPELGSMEIKMQLNQEQTSIQVQVQSPQVRDVLEANAQRLRDALAEQGLELASFDVSQQQSESGQGGQQQDAPAGDSGNTDTLMAAEESGAATVTVRQSDGLLDAYA